jgi:hypothetical protein
MEVRNMLKAAGGEPVERGDSIVFATKEGAQVYFHVKGMESAVAIAVLVDFFGERVRDQMSAPLTWCPLREDWVGPVLLQEGHEVRRQDVPGSPLVRVTALEHVVSQIVEAWQWARELIEKPQL